MHPFTTHTGTAIPLRAENVDTDQIIPARYLTTVSKDGLGEGLFADWRRQPDGVLRAEFPLNQPQYGGATILIAGPNFGCGSSREHAPWAIQDAGLRVVLSPDFADIFYNNSLKNGLLPIRLSPATINLLWDIVEEVPATPITIDLSAQTVSWPGGQPARFEIDPFRKMCLLQGVDDLGYLLAKESQIATFERVSGLA